MKYHGTAERTLTAREIDIWPERKSQRPERGLGGLDECLHRGEQRVVEDHRMGKGDGRQLCGDVRRAKPPEKLQRPTVPQPLGVTLGLEYLQVYRRIGIEETAESATSVWTHFTNLRCRLWVLGIPDTTRWRSRTELSVT